MFVPSIFIAITLMSAMWLEVAFVTHFAYGHWDPNLLKISSCSCLNISQFWTNTVESTGCANHFDYGGHVILLTLYLNYYNTWNKI